MRTFLLMLVATLSTACANTAGPAKAPETPAAPVPTAAPAPTGDPFAVEGPLREEWFPFLKPPVIDPNKTKLGTPPPGLAEPPSSCGAFVGRVGAQKVACVTPDKALEALDAALSIQETARRDTALTELEGCTGLPVGVARALRIEFAPIECGEALAEPLLKSPPSGIGGIVYHALLGQAIASRLSRTAQNAPKLEPPFEKARVRAHIEGPIRTGLGEQAKAIEEVSRAAAELPYYAKGIAAVESGVADLRLVEVVREVPIPEEFGKDEALRNTYYASLDQALDPRKDRGRDATLVGLKQLELVGVIHDARVDRARVMLSKMYGGRRIDALDALLLPKLPELTPNSVEERLASKLPTLYAGLLLDEAAASRPATLRRLLESGIPLPQRSAMRKLTLSPDVQALYARAHFELARTYWSGVDFDQAAAHAVVARASSGSSPEATFVLALSLALRKGPENAADMMRKASRGFSLPDTTALDAIAKAPGPLAGFAAFDAALIRQIGATEGAPADYFRDVSNRFQVAAQLLADPKHRATAQDRAQAAAAVAATIAAPVPTPNK